MGRKKRAEIAKAQALSHGHEDALGAVTQALSTIDVDAGQGETSTTEASTSDPEHLIGFARIYSGTLSIGDEIFVLPPRFSPESPRIAPEPNKITITGLYLIMGRALEPLKSVPAGVVFGIAGLEGHILKTGTLCSQVQGGVNLAGVNMASQPIVRVALEPVNPSDLDKMINGIRLLVQSDPCAEYEVLESGEHVISTAGELHLERCLKDLRERFARCEIQAGEPLVPYRETIVNAVEMVAVRTNDQPRGLVIGTTTSKQVTMRIRVRPLPEPVTKYLEKHAAAIKMLDSEKRAQESREKARDHDGDSIGQVDHAPVFSDSRLSLADFQQGLHEAFEQSKGDRESWAQAVDHIAAFGPRRVGPNVLIDATRSGCCRRL